jgi:hypothetical protein
LRRKRLAEFLTTHDLLFAVASDERYEVDVTDGATFVVGRAVLELADEMLARGVTSFVHPLNLTPPKPTLLVDGPYDVFYWLKAYAVSGRVNPWDIRALSDIDPAAGSGKNAIRKYLSQNKGPLRARPTTSPVVVLLDWEDTEDDRRAVEALLADHTTSRAVLTPQDRANQELGATFRGIERFLGTELVESVAENPALGIVRGAGGAGPFELMPQTSDQAKQALIHACRARNDPADTQRLVDALDWLESYLPATTVPTTLPGL